MIFHPKIHPFLILSSFLLASTVSSPIKLYKPLENVNLFLGDIVLNSNRTKQTNGPFIFRNAMNRDDQLWSYAMVPIEIDPILGMHFNHAIEGDLKGAIISAFEEYHQKTCIRFLPRTTERDYIRFIYDVGCYSSVGRVGGMQTISLGNGCHCKGTIIHEMMHALGFYHEHSRSDRDDFVDIKMENIDDNAISMFLKLQPRENRIYTDYDYDSITHYDGKAFSKRQNLQTMIPKKSHVTLKHPCEKNQLSKLDVEKLLKLYQCES